MVRATTGGVMRSYRYNLMKSFITDNKARETVLTQRVFNSYAEDPAAAAKSFRLRKSRLMTSSQLKICDDTLHKYQGAFASLQKVSELIDTQNSSSDLSSLKNTTLRMLNDPTGDARTQLNKVLDNLSDTIVQNMNQTYGDEFIFAGADGYNVPFEVREEDGHKNLYYRGVPVDASEPKLQEVEDPANAGKTMNIELAGTDANGNATKSYVLASAEKIPIPDLQQAGGGLVTVTSKDGGTVYYLQNGAASIAQDDYDKLEADEKAMYTEIQDPANPGDPDKSVYYKTEDLVSKESADDTYANGILKDNAGNPYVYKDEQGNRFYISNDPSGIISKKDYDEAKLNADKLDYLANEKRFVDIGLGFKENEEGELIESSAFNECLSGLTYLGYGLDEDGDPKNIYSIVQRLKEIAAGVPEEGMWDEPTYDEFDRLVGKLEIASSEFKTQFTNQSAGVEKLENNYELLKENVDNLKIQYSNLEDVNMADAISSFLWAEYCYNAALKVGNSILSQTLMDYLQ